MEGRAEVIAALNEALAEELSAINQYFLHAEMLESWGYPKLAALTKKESIDEMKHAESLMERILFLDGMPGMTKVQLNIGRSVPDMLANDLKLESNAVGMYNRLIPRLVQAGDNGSAELMKKILADEEEHVDHLETQIHLIGEIGLQNYLSQQI